MEPKRTKYSEIARLLRAEIASGKYGETGRLPSEARLVKRFGVSRPTVARALRTLEAESLLVRRAGVGSFLQAGDGGAGSAAPSRLLALLVPDLGNTEIFQLICGEIAGLARVHDYSLVWGGSGQQRLEPNLSLQHAEQLCRQYIERRVSGVFFCPFEFLPGYEDVNRRIAVMLRDAGIQVVLLDRDFTPHPSRSDFDLVSIDNVAGGFLLAEHLIKLGCKRPAFVVCEHSAPSVNARIVGVREALARHRLEGAPDWVRIGTPTNAKFVRSLVAGRPWDAFICANDHTAALLLRALEQENRRVPEDVRVVGFDDVNYATFLRVELTTIHQPCRDIAITAFRAMLDRLAEPTLPARSLLVSPRLVVRESCGAYLAAKPG